MPWLLPSVIATMTGTALLSFIYVYLFLKDKKEYLGIWALSWLIYFSRYLFLLLIVINHETPILLIGNQIASLLSGVILLWGTYRFIGVRFPKTIIYCSCVGIAWIIISVSFKFSFLLTSLPTFTFLAIVYIWTGFTFIRSKITDSHEKNIAGWAFIIWGIHKANYPFLRPVIWFAPWGYLFGALLELVVAIGILLVYFQKIRNDLQKERYYLKKAQELGHIGTWELDLIQNKLYWTDENCRIFGVPEGSIVDYETFLDKIHPDDREYVEQEWEASIAGKPYDIEHRLLIDGNVTWVLEKADIAFDEKGMPIKAIGMTQDITERKRSEEELSSQKKLFETMFNTIPDGVVITNNKREIQLANKGMEYTFGYKPEDLFGKTTEILYADKSTYYDTGKSVFNNNSNKIGDLYVTRYQKKDATEFSGETFGAKLFDENGDWIGNLGIMRDISERERAELMLQQAQKMESIGTLAGGIAHDFNNILSPIMMHTEMAMDDLKPNDPLYLSMKEIYKASVRARDLVKQILTFAHKRSETKILLNSSPIVKEAIKPGISVILCTGFSDKINGKKAKEIGISAFVMKPIIMSEMASKIRDILDKEEE